MRSELSESNQAEDRCYEEDGFSPNIHALIFSSGKVTKREDLNSSHHKKKIAAMCDDGC